MFTYILVHVMYINLVEVVLAIKPRVGAQWAMPLPSNIVSPWFSETRTHYVYPGLLWTALAGRL